MWRFELHHFGIAFTRLARERADLRSENRSVRFNRTVGKGGRNAA